MIDKNFAIGDIIEKYGKLNKEMREKVEMCAPTTILTIIMQK